MDLNEGRIHAIAPAGAAAFKMPLNMTVDTNGWLYVADGGREQLLILDANENLVDTFGEKGKTKPRDVAVTADKIFVADLQSNCVHVLDKTSRALLHDIPRPEDKADVNSKLFQPINIAVDSRGQLYVSDFGAYRIQVYDAEGRFLRSIGQYGDNYGEFARPKGVAVDRENRVYVVDAAGQHVQIFDETGRLLMWFGEPSGSRVGLNLPAKVLLDYDDVELFQRHASPDFKLEHLVIVMNQYGNRKVSVFGFGHKK
jgi:DNA-binding beta-propeller fold protein YncE